ncbi:cadherin repeat domain-containing protein, partial [Bathymodiolus thermophilus thioautotrophic gill symbiont]
MNTFNRFIITTLLVFFTSQAFASDPVITELKRIDVKTFQITFDQPVQGWESVTESIDNPRVSYSINKGATYYLGSPSSNSPSRTLTPISPIGRFATQWTWEETAILATLDADNLDSVDINLGTYVANNNNEIVLKNLKQTISLTDYLPLAITTNNLTTPEGVQTIATLSANKDGATFSLDGTADNNNLFKIENSVLKFKNANGADYDTTSSKIYTIHIKATKSGKADTTKTIEVTLTDVNDSTPTDITLSNSTLTIPEGRYEETSSISSRLFLVANLGAIDVDTTNTFTFSLENNTGNFFKIINNTKLRIIKSVDYEVIKTLSVDVKVTDGAGHEYTKIVTVVVTDVNDNTPKNLQLNPLTIIDGTPANTQIATVSATDADANTQFYYEFVIGENDNNKFALTIDGKLSITETVNLATKSSYKVYIRVADGNASDPLKRDLLGEFTLTVKPRLTITSSNTLNINEGENTTHTLTANENATFSIIENTSNLFSLSGTNNATLAFNGTTTDFESATKSYSVKVKATTGNEDYKNTEQTIAINLVDINDNTPTDILLTGNIDNNVGTIEDDKRKLLDGSSSGTVATLTTTDA